MHSVSEKREFEDNGTEDKRDNFMTLNRSKLNKRSGIQDKRRKLGQNTSLKRDKHKCMTPHREKRVIRIKIKECLK